MCGGASRYWLPLAEVTLGSRNFRELSFYPNTQVDLK